MARVGGRRLGDPKAHRVSPAGAGSGPSATTYVALALAPAAWMLFFGLAWTLPPAACEAGTAIGLHLFLAGCLAAALAGLALALGRRRRERAVAEHGFLVALAAPLSGLLPLGLVLAFTFLLVVGTCQ